MHVHSMVRLRVHMHAKVSIDTLVVRLFAVLRRVNARGPNDSRVVVFHILGKLNSRQS
jgi:hypothetical protein